jgi:hypothetical protein
MRHQIYTFHPRVGLHPQTTLLLYYSPRSYIQSPLCTEPRSRTSHREGDLCTKNYILLPKIGQMHRAKLSITTLSTFYKITVENKATTHINSLAQITSRLSFLEYIPLIYTLQDLTIGLNNG